MKTSTSELKVLNKVQEIMDKGNISRAQRIISDYLISNTIEPCIALQALNALCFYQLGDHDKALSSAESLIHKYKNDFGELLPIEIISFILRTLGFYSHESIHLLSEMYMSGWKNTSITHVGEKYSVTRILLGDYAEFRRSAAQIFKISKDPKHRLWSILGNCLNDENESLRSLGMTMLWRYLSQFFTSEPEISCKEWKKLLSFYMFNRLRDCQNRDAEKYEESFRQVAHDVIAMLSKFKGAPGCKSNSSAFNIGWVIAALIDFYLDNPLVSGDPDCKTPAVLCIYFLESDILVQEISSSSSINPRNNFKYFRFLIDRQNEFVLDIFQTELLLRINQYIGINYGSSDTLNFKNQETLNLTSRIGGVPCSDCRMKALTDIYRSIQSFDIHEMKPLVESLLEFCKKYGRMNEWACFSDVWPLFDIIMKKTADMGQEFPFVGNLDCGLQELPCLQLMMHLMITRNFPELVDPSTVHQKLTTSLTALKNPSCRSCFCDYVIAQTLFLQNENFLALIVLQFSPYKSDLSRLISIYVSGKMHLLDINTLREEISFSNVQHDTMSYIYFDSLIDGYYHEHLKKVCSDSLEFYRLAAGPDSLQLVECALNSSEWIMLQKEIPLIMRKLKYSLRRIECVVWHVLGSIELMTVGDAVQYLEKWHHRIEEVYHILTMEKSRICINDDKTILGCILDRFKGRSDADRIEDLLQIISFLHFMRKSSGLEWQNTDCFGLRKYISQHAPTVLRLNSIDSLAIRRLCFPGLSLLLCSLQKEIIRGAEDCAQKLLAIRSVVDYAHQSLSAEMEFQDILDTVDSPEKENLKSLVACMVPDFSAALNYYSLVRRDNLNRWRMLLERRRVEILSFSEKLIPE